MDDRAVSSSPEFAEQTVRSRILRWRSEGEAASSEDVVVREEPLEIRVQGRSIAITMRTPGHDFELTAGFLLSEGLIKRAEDILELAHCRAEAAATDQNVLNVFLGAGVTVNFESLTRHVYASSSCGICGKSSIDAVHQHFPPVQQRITVKPEMLITLPDRLRAVQEAFEQTGGLHAAAVFDLDGKLHAAREDVGRHNAVDKVIGFGLLNRQLPFDAHILLVSGRALI